jgi:hypothetical protein
MKTNDEIGASVEPLRKQAAAPQEEAIAEIVSASHDQAEFGERAINFLRDFQHLEYGTKLYPAPQAVQAAVPEGWKLAPIKVPDSAFAWVSGGYPAGFKAGDKRDTAVVHERAQRTWEAILNGITAPAHPAEGVPAQAAAPAPDERAAFEAWLGIKPCGAAHDFGWAAWRARAALAATQPAAQGMDAQDAALWREHVSKLDALITYCPTCCQGFASSKDMSRDEVIFECGKTAGRSATLAAQAKQGGA